MRQALTLEDWLRCVADNYPCTWIAIYKIVPARIDEHARREIAAACCSDVWHGHRGDALAEIVNLKRDQLAHVPGVACEQVKPSWWGVIRDDQLAASPTRCPSLRSN